jgi:signal peptidase I
MTEPTQSVTEPTEGAKAKESESVGELIKTLLYALLIALGIRTIAYEPFNIPSESMVPDLLVGDYLFVAKWPYGYSRYSAPLGLPLFDGRIFQGEVKRGDVVVFKWPGDNRMDYIKRVVGLPGDTVQMVNGQLILNGTPVPRERVSDLEVAVSPNTDCIDMPQYRMERPDGSAVCRYPQFKETLPDGRVYYTLDLQPDAPRDNTRPFLVPANHYFMMGDNRDNSQDSRVDVNSGGVGFVPAENLVGRADVIFFSTDGSARLWTPWRWFSATRTERLFRPL